MGLASAEGIARLIGCEAYHPCLELAHERVLTGPDALPAAQVVGSVEAVYHCVRHAVERADALQDAAAVASASSEARPGRGHAREHRDGAVWLYHLMQHAHCSHEQQQAHLQ